MLLNAALSSNRLNALNALRKFVGCWNTSTIVWWEREDNACSQIISAAGLYIVFTYHMLHGAYCVLACVLYCIRCNREFSVFPDTLVTSLLMCNSNTRQERPTESAEHLRQGLMTVNTLLSRVNESVSPIDLHFKQREHTREARGSTSNSASSSVSAPIASSFTDSLAEDLLRASAAGPAPHSKQSTSTAPAPAAGTTSGNEDGQVFFLSIKLGKVDISHAH